MAEEKLSAGDVMGANQSADLKGRAGQYVDKLDAIDKLKAEALVIKNDAKSEGYDMKLFGQVVKEIRKGYGFVANQLQFELELNAYRKACDIPTDLKKAQELAAQEANSEPESKTEKKTKTRRGRMN